MTAIELFKALIFLLWITIILKTRKYSEEKNQIKNRKREETGLRWLPNIMVVFYRA